MRKIDLSDYEVEIGGQKKPYQMKKSLEMLLFHPDLKLNFYTLMENHKVAQKILSSNGQVLLEDSEYERLETSVKSISGFTQPDIEFVRRILEAEKVEVVEK